ncbi:hypothetical protein ACVIGA_005073 [Bradyrhizobium sp. USDA 3240]
MVDPRFPQLAGTNRLIRSEFRSLVFLPEAVRHRPVCTTMRYVAYAVDLWGATHATYELECGGDDEARRRSLKFLEAHPVVELWSGPRRIARLMVDGPGTTEHGAAPLKDVEPEKSQVDMAREQLSPLGVPGWPGPRAHSPQVQENTRRLFIASDMLCAPSQTECPHVQHSHARCRRDRRSHRTNRRNSA